MPEKKRIVVDGLPLTWYEAGEGSPLILLHGWPQTSHIWRKVFPELQKFYRVIAIDLPGMGNDNAAPAADTQTVAGVIKAFCDALKLENIHLVAHDIGAWVAVAFAFKYEALLKSLVVLDAGIPGLIPDEIFSPSNARKIWQFYFHAVDEIPEFLLAGKEKEYLHWYFKNKTTVKGAINDDDLLIYTHAYTGQERLKYGFDYYRAFPESAAQNKCYKNKLKLPILAIGGENAQALNMGLAMQKASLNSVHSASIAECGHYIAEEQPEKFLELLLSFFKDTGVW